MKVDQSQNDIPAQQSNALAPLLVGRPSALFRHRIENHYFVAKQGDNSKKNL